MDWGRLVPYQRRMLSGKLTEEHDVPVEDIFSVSDQVVCISGASRGLGKGLAQMFAERGAHVVIASYDAAELAKARLNSHATAFP